MSEEEVVRAWRAAQSNHELVPIVRAVVDRRNHSAVLEGLDALCECMIDSAYTQGPVRGWRDMSHHKKKGKSA